MRILHIITSLKTGGAEALLTDLVPLMKSKGYQVDVLVFDGTRTPFYEKLEKSGVHVFALSSNVNVYRISNVWKVISFLSRYDIVHTHNTACQLYVAIAKKISKAKCRLVTTEHSTYNRRRDYQWMRPLDSWMYRQYQSIVCISDIATRLLVDHIGGDFPVSTINNGVNVEKYYKAEAYTGCRKEADVVVVMVAAFRVGKQQETLIRALPLLPEHFKVWLVGDGERRLECETLAQSLSVSDRVRFWGVRTDVPQLLKTSDIVVMSTHYEGMSLSNIEGMSAGKPFVASNVNGIKEITEGAGVLFEEQNERELADILLKLSTDKVYYNEIAERCFLRAKEFDISKTVEGYLRIYEKIMLE